MKLLLQRNATELWEACDGQPHRRTAWAGLFALALLVQPVAAQTDGSRAQDAAPDTGLSDKGEVEDILDMDIEQLGRVDVVVPSMDLEVTSVTRTESTVGRSPAAVFVITPEMIRRSGATSIPEVLRMVPGLDVAKTNANTWAITSRGFNSRFANKLLVQVDGRSVYSPMFSGVHWEVLDLMLEDIERIEVIRGPGATVWGANAVNGVISITTKKASETQGLLISGGAGTEERGFTTARYGGSNGDDLHWRIYGKQFDRDMGFSPDRVTHDDWRKEQGGFRVLSARSTNEPDAGGWAGWQEGRHGGRHKLKLFAVRFDGTLQVADPGRLREAVRRGIGSGKGLGFGLLSLAQPGGG